MADFDDDDNGGPEVDPSAFYVPVVLPGDRCTTNPGDRPAQVKFVGTIQGMPKGYWIGVQYDEKVGKNDGRVKGKRYFQCPPGHGGFLRSVKVTKIEPEVKPDDELSSPGGVLVKRAESPAKPSLKLDEMGTTADSQRQSHRLSTRQELEGEVSEGLASRIARRRKEGHSSRVRSTSPTWSRTLESWHEEIAPSLDPKAATPATSYATGDGLQKAVVASLAQFTINARDPDNEPSTHKANSFVVAMRGSAHYRGSQPALVRVKVINRGDGSYMCEYRPYMTGNFTITVTLHGCHILGSPFDVSVITVRPNPARCVCKGEALHKAIARTPMKFDLLFVDQMGHPAVAEEVDLYLEPYEEEAAATGGGESAKAEKAVEPAEGEKSPDASPPATRPPSPPPAPPPAAASPTGKRVGASEESEPTEAVREEVTTEPAPAPTASARANPKASARSNSSPRRTGRRSARSIGGPGEYTSVEATTRQRHLALWTQRMTADKLRQRTAEGEAVNAENKGKKDNMPQAHTSFAHEMTIDPIGFAFGGVDPGTLHAHGKLVKVHSVHYSVGLAGKYLMHVGLRQQMVPLPGSPFKLVVEPGAPFATSSRLPEDSRHMSGVASEAWQHGLIFPTKDVLGNMCNKGGASLVMKLSKAAPAEEKSVEFSIVDKEDGSYELKWKCAYSGHYPIDVLMGGAHVAGSPVQLNVNSAKPAVEQMTVTGSGQSKAIAGIKAKLMVKVADCFGNKFDASTQTFPYKLGLILKPSAGQKDTSTDKFEKKSKAAKDEKRDTQMRGKGAALDENSALSLPFDGKMIGSVFEIDYVAKEAGLMDLHVWAESSPDGVTDETNIIREPLPASPFQVQVSEGSASALGSYVGEAEAGKQGAGDGFGAGEHVVLRPQITDDFGNSSAAAEGELTASHVKPDSTGSWESAETAEELPPPRAKGALGSYELLIEPVRAGLHYVHIRLGGQDISGSPVSFNVAPGPPTSSKCKLKTVIPPNDEPLWEKSPITIRVTLFDKYGNQLEKGGVRVDAKASGVGVSQAKTEDNKDGTYDINLMSGPPGDIKVMVRIDGNDLPPYQLTVQRNPEAAQEAAAKEDREKEEQDAKEEKDAKASKGGKKDGGDEAAKDAAKGKAEPKKEEIEYKPVPWMTASKLLELCDPALAQAAELEARDCYKTFELRLGAVILKRLGEAGKIEDLLREWDGNGDGDVSKIEFRQCVTGKSLKMKAPNKEIDDFFSTIDADGSGSVDLKELKPAIKMLKEKASAADAQKQRFTDRAKELRDKVELIKKSAEDTDAVEKYEAKLIDMKVNPNIDARIGLALNAKNMKVIEIVGKWDKDGDGTVDKEEFRKNIKELNVGDIKSFEIDELYTKLDTDGGGDLSLDEVTKCFVSMQKAATSSQQELKAGNKQLGTMKKDVAKSHAQIMFLEKKHAEDLL